jgi:hypothetical protein
VCVCVCICVCVCVPLCTDLKLGREMLKACNDMAAKVKDKVSQNDSKTIAKLCVTVRAHT